MPTLDNSKQKRIEAIAAIRSYLMRYRTGLSVGAVCLVLTDLLLLINPWVLKKSIDELSDVITRDRLYFYAGVLVGVTLISGVFRFFMRRIMIGISRKIEADMRSDFFSHLQTQSPEFFGEHRTGDLMALATNDLNAVRMLVGPGVMYSLNTIVVGTLSTVLMVVLSWKLTVAVILPMALLIFAVYKNMKIINRLFDAVQRRFAAINSRAQENLSGIRVVKAYAREEYEIEKFKELSADYLEKNMTLYRVQSLLHPLLTSLAALGVLCLLAVGGRLVIDGAITLGTFVAFNGYLTMLIWPMIAIGWVMNITERGLASMQRINEVAHIKTTISDPLGSAAERPLSAYSIRFENVSFSYHRHGEGPPVIRDLSFEIGDGETVALFGATGSGKSTLVSLIMRLRDVDSGSVLVGGREVRAIPLHQLRDAIGLVPQDIFLFSDSIRDNVGFGVDTISNERLHEVAETASIHEEIMEFPDGYESVLGERGINLSGGQKQRVAIARALAKNPRILILDDALSSVDATTEEKILGSMSSEIRARTTLIISHRVSTAREADRILVLDNGALVEEGTHDELVALGGIYADMNYKQMIMVELES